MKENKRYLYLLNESNEITDTMKCSAITDIITMSDSTFVIWDLNYSVEIKIENDKFVLSRLIQILADFNNYLGLSVIIDNYMVGKKYIPEDDCIIFKAAKLNQPFYLIGRKTYRYERGLYNLNKNDTMFILMTNKPRNIKLTKKQKDQIKLNKNINTFTLLSSEYTCKKRTTRYYGRDNFEVINNQLYLFERNSCTIYSFDLGNNLSLKDKCVLPVKNNKSEGWKYFVDNKNKKHYAVKRVKKYLKPVSENIKKKKVKVYYEYYIYEIDWKSKKNIIFIKREK
jgi:hypothetical protein